MLSKAAFWRRTGKTPHRSVKRAKMRKKELEEQGIQAKIYREEPFMVGDDTPFKIYVMKFKTKNGNRTSQIEEIR